MALTQAPSFDVLHARRKRRNRIIIAAFFFFIAIVVVIESPLTRVRQFSVSGNQTVPSSRILADAMLRTGMNLWQVNQNHINAMVQYKEPLVQHIAMRMDYLHGIVHLIVQEKHVVALLEVSGQFYTLLNDGVVFSHGTGTSGYTWPIISSSMVHTVSTGHPSADSNVSVVCNQLSGLAPSILGQISEFHLDQLGTVTIYLNNQFEVRCRADHLATDMNTAMTAVSYFMGKGNVPGVIDVTGAPPYEYTPLSPSSK